MTVVVEEITHSSLGASGSGRWMNCPGSILLTKKLGEKADHSSGEAAAEGTCAHEVLSECLLNDQEPWEWLGTEMEHAGWEFTADQDMIDSVNTCYHFIKKIIAENAANTDMTGAIYVESQLQHPKYPLMFGTVDFGLLVFQRKIIIIDFKHGININVEPTSSQLWYYACLILATVDARLLPDDLADLEVEMYIVQPRQPHPKGPIRCHTMTGAELLTWFNDTLIPAMEETTNPNALLSTGEHCRFCPAKDHCPALISDARGINPEVNPETLSDEELDDLLGKRVALNKFFERLGEVQYKRALQGAKFANNKLVKKKADRTWKPGGDDKAMDDYGDEAFGEPKLKSPAQMSLLPGGKKFVARWAYTPDLGLTMAPRSDKRMEVERVNRGLLDAVESDQAERETL